MSPHDEPPTAGEMFAEIFDLLTGLGILLLPISLLAIPGLVLLLPLALLAIPVAILAGPFLLIHAVRRWSRRDRTPRRTRSVTGPRVGVDRAGARTRSTPTRGSLPASPQ